MTLRFIVSIVTLLLATCASDLFAQQAQNAMSINIYDPASGAGLEGVRIRWRDFRDGSQVKGEAVTDAAGNALIPMPPPGVQFFQLYMSKKGYVTLRAFWPFHGGRGMVGDVQGTPEPPQVYDIVMEAGHKASGKVVDENNKPVEGAVVTIFANKKLTTPNTATDIINQQVKTGADGVFSMEEAPSPIDVAKIKVFHPKYSAIDDTYTTPEKLLDGSAVFTMSKGIMVEGTVTGPDGKPLVGATVLLGTSISKDNPLPTATTDANGKYQIGVPQNTTATLTVKSRNMAPDLQRVEVKTESAAADFQLKPARRISGKVVPPPGQTFPGGYVYVQAWRDAHTITEQIFFGADGRFFLQEAPHDEVQVLIKSYGDNSYSYYTIPKDEKEVTIQLK